MSIEVESGVPIPEGNGGYKYPWLKMEVGDSFVCPDGTSAATFRNSAYAASVRFSPKKFSVRAVGGVLRCWRIA